MLTYARFGHTATLLPNGEVLVVGGIGGNSTLDSDKVELYDPASGTWRVTGSLATGRYWHTATLLPDGKVLVAGGENFNIGRLLSAELYDPASWELDANRQPHLHTRKPHGHLAARRQSARCRRL